MTFSSRSLLHHSLCLDLSLFRLNTSFSLRVPCRACYLLVRKWTATKICLFSRISSFLVLEIGVFTNFTTCIKY